jgi:HEAT repeat protein
VVVLEVRKMAIGDSVNLTISINKLISALSSNDDMTRIQARQALTATGEAAVPYLVEALDNPDNIERWEAVKTLAEIGGPSAIPGLIKALENEKFEVRWVAANGLIKMGPRALKPLFQALMDHGDSVLLRENAHYMLHELAKEELKQYLTPLLTALEGKAPEVEVPIRALKALESIDEFERTSRKMNEALLRQLTILQATMPGQRVTNVRPHERIRMYVKVLNEQQVRSILRRSKHVYDARAEAHAARA